MRIRAQRDDLADALARANRAVGTRTALPVLQGLLCEVSGSTLRVTGTDLDMTVRTQAEVEVLEEGRAVIPGRLLSEAVRKMPAGQVTIGVTDTDIEIQGNGPRFTLRPLTVEDFPTQEELVADGVEVDGEDLAEAINQVTIAASGDGARPILTGVLFETSDDGLRMVATDSYRLAKRDLKGVGLEGTGLVPGAWIERTRQDHRCTEGDGPASGARGGFHFGKRILAAAPNRRKLPQVPIVAAGHVPEPGDPRQGRAAGSPGKGDPRGRGSHSGETEAHGWWC